MQWVAMKPCSITNGLRLQRVEIVTPIVLRVSGHSSVSLASFLPQRVLGSLVAIYVCFTKLSMQNCLPMLSKLPYLEAPKLPDVRNMHLARWRQDCGLPEVCRIANLARDLVFDSCPSLRLITVNCNYSNALGPVTLSILYQKDEHLWTQDW